VTTIPTNAEIIIDPEHTAALAAMNTRTARVRYACEQQGPPVTTAGVQKWLAAYGYPTTKDHRPQVSRTVNEWRKVREIADTADQLALTEERLAELDEIARQAEQPETTGPALLPVPMPAPAAPPAVIEPEPAAEPTPARAVTIPKSGPARASAFVLLTLVAVLLAGVIVAPIALSSQDIIDWAGSPTGLGLSGAWPWVTFFALDAAAAVCVCLVVYCASRGESAGIFGLLVWVFAAMSAFANYQHASGLQARDAVWFFPAMSIAGPFLLEMVIRRIRKWVQEGTGQRARHSVSFGFARWVPGVGATRETYGAWRLARLDGINDAKQAITAYRELCPDGSIRVLKALRKRA
jgi:hypothetical protein